MIKSLVLYLVLPISQMHLSDVLVHGEQHVKEPTQHDLQGSLAFEIIKLAQDTPLVPKYYIIVSIYQILIEIHLGTHENYNK